MSVPNFLPDVDFVRKQHQVVIFLNLRYLMSGIPFKQANSQNNEHQACMITCNVIALAAQLSFKFWYCVHHAGHLVSVLS